ncbi:MAG: membrane protein insertase YidC [Deltaproteobacteria bacterium]|nr:MAG: membrane protein insertase YidC [Deltaproteobacteria bacterium]
MGGEREHGLQFFVSCGAIPSIPVERIQPLTLTLTPNERSNQTTMQDSKNLILFIVLSVGVLFGWGILFPPPKPAKRPPINKTKLRPKPGQRNTTPARTRNGSKVNPSTRPSSQPSSRATTVAARNQPTLRPAPPRRREPVVPTQTASFSNKLFTVKVSNHGGGLLSMQLKKFRQGKKEKRIELNLMDNTLKSNPPLMERLLDEQLQTGGAQNKRHIIYSKISQPKPNEIALTGQVNAKNGGHVLVEKKYVFQQDSYKFHVEYRLTNRTGSTIKSTVALTLTDHEDPSKLTAGGMFSQPELLQVLCQDPKEQQPQRFDSTELAKSTNQVSQSFSKEKLGVELFRANSNYAALDRRYFLFAFLPEWGKGDQTTMCKARGNNGGWVQVELTNDGVSLAPNQSREFKVAAYFGPKYYSNLQKVGKNLQQTINFGFFAFLSRPMLWLMQFFYNSMGSWANWGLAIILLTLLVKLITWPLTHRSMASMKKMQKLKPEMDRLKEKYGDDKESFQREMMNVYVKEGINPISGCLPMLVQMPVWFALYNTLFYAVELYQAPFIPGWIDDLSSKDPLYILPISMGVAMFIQQKITPQTMDNAQAKAMLWFMPIFFTFIMLFLPAGLTLYIFVNTILGLLHHWYIHTQPDEPEDKKPKKKKKAGWMERMQKLVDEQQQSQK